jgi:hypothetical protein
MQSTYPDAFALRNSGLDAFLYAEVGPELGGSTLTILSTLARLGKDPWAEAARLVKLPKAAVLDSLAQSIGQMPLTSSGLAEARNTAARVMLLLPTQTEGPRQGMTPASGSAQPRRAVLLVVLYCTLGLWLGLNVILASRTASTVPAPTTQSIATVPH